MHMDLVPARIRGHKSTAICTIERPRIRRQNVEILEEDSGVPDIFSGVEKVKLEKQLGLPATTCWTTSCW